MSTDVRPARLARWISPTLGIGMVDLALGIELVLSASVKETTSTFIAATGGRVPAAALLSAIGLFTIWGVIHGGRMRRAALLVNALFWAYVTATLLQRPSDSATLMAPTLTGGYALISVLRYMQLKGLRRDTGG